MQELGEIKVGEEKDSQPPFVIVVGPLDNPTKYFVILKGASFPYNNLIEAVNVCFKSCIALHSWSKLSNHVWAFLQTYIYRLESDQSSSFIQNIHVPVTEFFQQKVEPNLKANSS